MPCILSDPWFYKPLRKVLLLRLAAIACTQGKEHLVNILEKISSYRPFCQGCPGNIPHWLLLCVASSQGFRCMQQLCLQLRASCLAWCISLHTSLLSNALGGNLLHLHSVLHLPWKHKCWWWMQERLASRNDLTDQAAVHGPKSTHWED